MEAACRHALDIGTLSYGSVKSILATGRDRTEAAEQHELSLPAEHDHIRGPQYYANRRNGKESSWTTATPAEEPSSLPRPRSN